MLGLSVCNIKLLFCLPLTKFIVDIVYHAVNVISKEDIAIKFKPIDMENPSSNMNTAFIKASQVSWVCYLFVHWFRTEGNYNAMVLKLLGPSLEELFNCNNCKFSLKIILIWLTRW